MSPISKFEAVGIFISVAVMAVALALLNFHTHTIAGSEPSSQAGAVIVSSNGEASDMSTALASATTNKGKLERLVIEDVRKGDGASVKSGDTVRVDYIGSTRDGVQFDSSYARGTPFEFTVGDGKVIQGWDEGLIGMKVGGERILVVPPQLAYGDRQVGPIPPNTPLVFAIELLDIK